MPTLLLFVKLVLVHVRSNFVTTSWQTRRPLFKSKPKRPLLVTFHALPSSMAPPQCLRWGLPIFIIHGPGEGKTAPMRLP